MTGETLRFRVRARSIVGYGPYSEEFSIIAATVPSIPDEPSTEIGGDEIDPTVIISWSLPADNGGFLISGYKVEIKTSANTYETLLKDCDA